MRALARRLSALEGETGFYSVGDLLDSLDGEPLSAGKMVAPSLVSALEGMPDA